MIRLGIILRSQGTPCPLTPPSAGKEFPPPPLRLSRGQLKAANHQSLPFVMLSEFGLSLAKDRPSRSIPIPATPPGVSTTARATVQEPGTAPHHPPPWCDGV